MGTTFYDNIDYESKLPNFERDEIDSSSYASQSPMKLTASEIAGLSEKYDIGHVVYDTKTERHYVWTSGGWALPTMSNTTVRFATFDGANEVLHINDEPVSIATGLAKEVYEPLATKPADWDSRYWEYYVWNNFQYHRNTNSSWSANTYYQRLLSDV